MFTMRGNTDIRSFLNIIGFVAALSMSAGQPCSPRFPALIPASGGDYPSQNDGIWYGYRHGGDVAVNPIITVTGFGPTIDPSSGDTAHQQYIQIVSSASTERQACQNQFTVQTYAENGMIIGNQAVSRDYYSVIRLRTFTILHHDSANLIVAYGCAVPKADGTCDTPIIFAETRVKHIYLSAYQMASFDSIINDIFKDYCITTDSLPKQIYNSSQAQCPNLDPPACLGSVIKGMQESLTANVTDGQTTKPPPDTYSVVSTSPTSAPGSGCKWPVYLPSAVSYNPASHEGLWYVYRQLWSPEPSATNMRIYWHNLGKGFVPLTNWTGNYMWAESTQFDNASATQCSFAYWTGFLGSTGGNLGFRFVSADGRQVPLRATTAYADDQFQFYYSCVTPNVQTRVCDNPYGLFSARTDVSQWTEAEKSRADDIINRLLQDYGCSAKDIPIMPSLPGKPICNFEGGTTCVRQYIAGFSELVEPVKSTYN